MPATDPIIRPRELPEHVGLSKATVQRLINRGDFPRPLRLSPGAVGWRKSTLDAWLAARDKAAGEAA